MWLSAIYKKEQNSVFLLVAVNNKDSKIGKQS